MLDQIHQDHDDSLSLNAPDKTLPNISESPPVPIVSRLELWSYYLCKNPARSINVVVDLESVLEIAGTDLIQLLTFCHSRRKIIMEIVSDYPVERMLMEMEKK